MPNLVALCHFVVPRLNHAVAFARAFRKTFCIGDCNAASAVLNETGSLENISDQRHGVASYTYHLGEKLLRQRQCIAAGEVTHPQQPSRKARFGGMKRNASPCLLGLN